MAGPITKRPLFMVIRNIWVRAVWLVALRLRGGVEDTSDPCRLWSAARNPARVRSGPAFLSAKVATCALEHPRRLRLVDCTAGEAWRNAVSQELAI